MSDYISKDEFGVLVVLLVVSITFTAVAWAVWSARIKHWKAKAAHHEWVADVRKKSIDQHGLDTRGLWAEKEVCRLEGQEQGRKQVQREATSKGVAVYVLDPGTGAIKFCWCEDPPK